MSALVESPLVDLAVGVTRGWTALYTWRLPDEIRDSRRAEIESDLWEHRHLAMMADETIFATALGIILRLLLGLPADLAWRLEARSLHRSVMAASEPELLRWGVRIAYAAIVVAIYVASYSVIVATANFDLLYGLFAIPTFFGTIATFWGLRISATRQPLGILLIAGGTTMFSLTWLVLGSTMIMFLPGAGLVALSYYRGRRAGWTVGSILKLDR